MCRDSCVMVVSNDCVCWGTCLPDGPYSAWNLAPEMSWGTQPLSHEAAWLSLGDGGPIGMQVSTPPPPPGILLIFVISPSAILTFPLPMIKAALCGLLGIRTLCFDTGI